MMRILVLDTNVAYANPTSRVILSALAQQADIVFGGIGYGLDTSNLHRLEQRTGRFDIIIGQTWMFGAPGVGQYGAFVPRDLHDHPAPKILNLLQVDPYAVPEYIYNSCVVPADGILTTVASPQMRLTDPKIAALQEPWFDPNLFLVRHPELINERWLMLPHCIAEDEFVPVGRLKKRWDVIVPGVGYRFRRLANEHLDVQPGVTVASLDGPVQRLLYWATCNYRAQKYIDVTGVFHRRFRNRIAASRVAVTCDGSIGYAIRKFFEIPAFGTLLAARFFPDMETLGFHDGINCFAITDELLDRLDEVISFAKSDSAQAHKIAVAGQEMVRELHLADVRARQLLSVLERLCSGNLGRLRWHKGCPILSDPEKEKAL